MKAYAIITIAFWIQLALAMIYVYKIWKNRKKDKGDLSSVAFTTPVFAKVEIHMEDLMTDGRAEEKIGAELFLRLRERGCVRVHQVHNERDFTSTVTCIVIATPFDRD